MILLIVGLIIAAYCLVALAVGISLGRHLDRKGRRRIEREDGGPDAP